MFDNSRFFVGIVKDNDDTHRPNPEDQRQGKVQVRILGVHDILNVPDSNEGRGVEDKDLPWCACLMPNIFGGVATQGTVPNPSLQIGAWVFGVSLDETFQNNIILGIICLPQNMSPSSLASGGFADGGSGNPIAPVNLSTSCLDKYEYSILGVESGTYLKSSDYNWERLMQADDLNQKATEGRSNIKGLFQIELKQGTAKEAYDYAVQTGKIKIAGMSKEEVNRKVAESAEFNVVLGRAMCEKKLADAKELTGGSGSLMYAAGLYNIGCGNFDNFLRYLKNTKNYNLTTLDDDTIANEYYNFFKSRSPANATYLKKLKDQMNQMGGSNCFAEARAGSDLTKMSEGTDATGKELANRMLQELQKMGPLTYDQKLRMSKNHADCSSLTSRITYALGLTPRNDYTTSDMFDKEVLVKTGNFERAAILTTYQLNDQYLKPGDIVVCQGHAEIYLGGNKWIGARSSRVGVHDNDAAWSVSHKGKQCKIFRRKQ